MFDDGNGKPKAGAEEALRKLIKEMPEDQLRIFAGGGETSSAEALFLTTGIFSSQGRSCWAQLEPT